MGISIFPVPSSTTVSGTQTFTSSSTWTAPAGVTSVNYIAVAGGGGGGGGANENSNADQNRPGGGGAGGQVIRGSLSVTPGTTYPIVVGAGGAGASASTSTASFVAAQAGGLSSIAFSATVENAFINGAGENSNIGWFGGAANGQGSGNSPDWTSTFNNWNNQNPTQNSISRTTSTTVNTITGISSGSTTSFLRNTVGLNPGGTDYADIMAWVPVTGSTSYVISGYYGNHSNTQSVPCRIRVDWFTGFNSGLISTSQNSTVNTNNSDVSWARMSLTATAPSNATFALVRFMNWNYAARWTGLQMESGSTLTDYVGPNSSGFQIFTGLGIVNVASGAAANGGGGGASRQTGTDILGIGFGGGAVGPTTGRKQIAGHGSGAGGAISPPILIASQNSIPFISSTAQISNGGTKIVSGSNGYAYDPTNNGYMFQPNGAAASPEGYGAGGMGALGGDVIPGRPGVGAGNPVFTATVGNSAVANSGAGGGGGQNSTASSPTSASGGNGGSGIVILNW
jgi:hypothetical protein